MLIDLSHDKGGTAEPTAEWAGLGVEREIRGSGSWPGSPGSRDPSALASGAWGGLGGRWTPGRWPGSCLCLFSEPTHLMIGERAV